MLLLTFWMLSLLFTGYDSNRMKVIVFNYGANKVLNWWQKYTVQKALILIMPLLFDSIKSNFPPSRRIFSKF